jgi:hypothetical protein
MVRYVCLHPEAEAEGQCLLALQWVTQPQREQCDGGLAKKRKSNYVTVKTQFNYKQPKNKRKLLFVHILKVA